MSRYTSRLLSSILAVSMIGVFSVESYKNTSTFVHGQRFSSLQAQIARTCADRFYWSSKQVEFERLSSGVSRFVPLVRYSVDVDTSRIQQTIGVDDLYCV